MLMPRSTPKTRFAAAALVAVIAGVHFQQYVDFMSEIPTVGVLFLLNAAGGIGLAFALISQDQTLRLLAALGSIGLAVGSLISIAIALNGNFFGYSEPSLRLPIVIAILAEISVIPLLALLASRDLPLDTPASSFPSSSTEAPLDVSVNPSGAQATLAELDAPHSG